MIPQEQFVVSQLEPIIKILKQREEMFFQLLKFVNKNIQSSSNEIDQIALFNDFIIQSAAGDLAAAAREGGFVQVLAPEEEINEPYRIANTSK